MEMYISIFRLEISYNFGKTIVFVENNKCCEIVFVPL